MSGLGNFAAIIPPQLAEADQVLTRYGRWAMDRVRRQCCGSAEGMYRSPQNDDDRAPREMLLPAWQAMAAHRALIGVPDRERIVLHILYVPKRLTVQVQLRRLRIPPQLSQQRHLLGLRGFANLYALEAK
jgi:hypothetical protein